MVHNQNGLATMAGPPIQLGDFLPEQRKVILNNQEYTAWVTSNRRYPRRIMVALDAASRRYSKVITPLLTDLPSEKDILPGDLAELQAERDEAFELQQGAYNDYVSECMSLLVQNLPESEADLIPLAECERALRMLGFFRPIESQVDQSSTTENEGGNEEKVPLTGDTSQEGSVTSIRRTRSKTS